MPNMHSSIPDLSCIVELLLNSTVFLFGQKYLHLQNFILIIIKNISQFKQKTFHKKRVFPFGVFTYVSDSF